MERGIRSCSSKCEIIPTIDSLYKDCNVKNDSDTFRILGPKTFIDKKEVLSFLFRIERFLPKPKPNIKRLENPDLRKRFYTPRSPIVQVINISNSLELLIVKLN
jgi:hypothetical protein